VYPSSPEEERTALRDAFLHVPSFRRVLEHYGGNKLPEKQYRENTLFTRAQDRTGAQSINERTVGCSF